MQAQYYSDKIDKCVLGIGAFVQVYISESKTDSVGMLDLLNLMWQVCSNMSRKDWYILLPSRIQEEGSGRREADEDEDDVRIVA